MAYVQRFPFEWRCIPERTNVADPLPLSPALRAIVAVTTRSRAAKHSAATAASADVTHLPCLCRLFHLVLLLLKRQLFLLQMMLILLLLIIASPPLSVVGQNIQP